MELNPGIYNFFIRPRWFSKKYIHDIICPEFCFNDKKVLDFGSGTGSNSFMFKPDNYIGLDIVPERVWYASKRYPEYNFNVLKGFELPLPEGTMDYVLLIAVLHHIPSEDLMKYLGEFRRVLKPGGSVIALEPCYFNESPFNNSFMTVFDSGKYIRDEQEYLNLFDCSRYSANIKKRFKKIFYNELFFTAAPKQPQ